MGTDDELPPVRHWDAETAYEQIRSEIAELEHLCGWHTVRYPIIDFVKNGAVEVGRPRVGADGIAIFGEKKVYLPKWSEAYRNPVTMTPSAEAGEDLFEQLTVAVKSLAGFPELQTAVDRVRVNLYMWPYYTGLKKAIDQLRIAHAKLHDKATWLLMTQDQLAKRALGLHESEVDERKWERAKKWIKRASKQWMDDGEEPFRDVDSADTYNKSGRNGRAYRGDFVRAVMQKYERDRIARTATKQAANP